MANPPPYPDSNLDTGDDTGAGPDRGSTTGTSRPRTVVTTWQKVVGIIGLLVLLALGARMFGAGGGHGPGQNTPVENQEQEIDTEDGGGHVPPPGVSDH